MGSPVFTEVRESNKVTLQSALRAPKVANRRSEGRRGFVTRPGSLSLDYDRAKVNASRYNDLADSSVRLAGGMIKYVVASRPLLPCGS